MACLGRRATVGLISLAVLALLVWVSLAHRVGAQEETGTCPNPQRIDEFRGTGSQTTDTFQTTTDSFRVRWEVDEANSSPDLEPSLFIRVNDEQNVPVGNASHDGGGSGETFVNEPPGTYSLEIDFIGGQGANYVITVEQCEGGNPSTNPGRTVPETSKSGTSQPKKTPDPPKSSPTPPPNPSLSPPPTPSPRPSPPAPPFKAGGPEDGPVPLMKGGSCPKEFPNQRGNACYASI